MYQFENPYGDIKFYSELPRSSVPMNGVISLSCPECDGSGMDLDGGQCDYCYGEGSSEYTLVDEDSAETQCPECDGSGMDLDGGHCYYCDGTGSPDNKNRFPGFKNLGFNKIGEWYIDTAKNIIDYNIDNIWKKIKGILYAYVMNEEIKYIGKSMNTIQSRLVNYKNNMNFYYENKKDMPHKEKLYYLYNAIINSRIDLGSLHLDTTKVEIFGFKPSKEISYNDEIKLDIPHGLEYPLIMKFLPEWNTVGKKKE